MKYETVIGLEVHVELSTQTKMFCNCKNEFGAAPNTHVCPVCLSMPGTLPVANRTALEYCVRAGYALNCKINNMSKMDRKNYVYPDLAKSYQISQLYYPLCGEGYVEIETDGKKKRLGITRIHIEEDAGKLVHGEGESYVDYNRGGVPLIEIVSEPDMRSADEAVAFLETIRANMQYVGVSDCKMQEGSLRCDVNVSVRPEGSSEYGTRTELKNINSFSAARRAIEAEVKRHISVLEDGEAIVQETRRWDDARGRSFPMRDKEDAHDYRYFPDPDLVPIWFSDEELAAIADSLPELPADKRARYQSEYGLSEYDAGVLTASRHTADYFEACVALLDEPKAICNYIMVDLLRLLGENGTEEGVIPVPPQALCDIVTMTKRGDINSSVAKAVLEEAFKTGEAPAAIVEKKGLRQMDDKDELLAMVRQLIEENPKPAADYRGGNRKALTFFVGRVMKQTQGKANPKTVNELVARELEK